MKTKITIILFLFSLMSLISLGAIDIKCSEDAFTETSMELTDYLFAGEELLFTGKADNLYFFGRKLTFQGEVESGLTAFGDRVILDGIVKNDTHIGATTIDILGDVEGTLFLGGKDIVIAPNSTIRGDLLAGAAMITINGVVDGDVYIGAGKVMINGIITGNLLTKTGKIIFGENGRIEGDLEYSSDWKLSEDDMASVSGTIEFTEFKEWDKNKFFTDTEFEENIKWIGPIVRIIIILSFLITGVLLLVFPVSKILEKERTERRFIFTALWGLIPFFVYPVLIALGFLLGLLFGITVPIALGLLLAGLPFLVFTQVLGITLFGQFLFRLFKWKKNSRHLFFLFGLAFAIIISFIPILSILGFIFFSAAGWGRLLESIFKVEFGKPVEAEV